MSERTTPVDLTGKRFGKRPPVNKPALRAAAFIDTALPTFPLVDAAPALSYPMDHNDQWGDCVVAGLDHALQVVHELLGVPRKNWDDAQLLAYYRTQNPTFDPKSSTHGPGSDSDGGMIVQDFLSYLVKAGVLLGFAKVSTTNLSAMKAATYLGLAIITGEAIKAPQERQVIWDAVGGEDLGGHCTTTVGYKGGTQDLQTCVTWGELVDMTPRFITQQMDEAWMIVTPAHVQHPGFRAGFDLAAFAQAYKDITGRAFPVDVTTPPAPAPAPVVDEDPALTAWWTETKPWADAPHVWSKATRAAKATRAYAASKGLLAASSTNEQGVSA